MTRRILIDVTRTAQERTHTGIQKVVRSLYRALSQEAGDAVEVIPVVLYRGGAYPLRLLPEHPYERADASGGQGLSAARRSVRGLTTRLAERVQPYVLRRRSEPHIRALRWIFRRAVAAPRLLARNMALLRRGRPVRFVPGDVLLLPDSAWIGDPWPIAERVKAAGGRVVVMWYDCLPITHPHFFPKPLAAAFETYLERSIALADRIICISRTVRAEVEQQARKRGRRPQIRHLYPIVAVAGITGQPPASLAAAFQGRPAVLIVATIEPRKGHALLLDACDQLWAAGSDFNLVVIGRVGWKVAELMDRFLGHAERGSRLFLFHDSTDGDVAYAFGHASLLVLPSQAEGLGLPILEAEMAGCPTLCSDIPVFREIASPRTRFFSPYEPAALASALRPFIEAGALPGSREPARTCATSDRVSTYVRDLLAIIDGEDDASQGSGAGSLDSMADSLRS